MLNILDWFDETLGRNRDTEEATAGLKDNRYLEKAISIFYDASTKENLVQILAVISKRMEQQGQLIRESLAMINCAIAQWLGLRRVSASQMHDKKRRSNRLKPCLICLTRHI